MRLHPDSRATSSSASERPLADSRTVRLRGASPPANSSRRRGPAGAPSIGDLNVLDELDRPRHLGWEEIPALIEEVGELAKRLMARWEPLPPPPRVLAVLAEATPVGALPSQVGELTWDGRSEVFAQ